MADAEPDQKKLVVVLVHGTFAQGAGWARESSSFARELCRLEGYRTITTSFSWSGRNLIGDRLVAAEALSTQVEEIRRLHPSASMVLVGHSHGGSVIAYALKANPLLGRQLAGCAFLSTPFVSMQTKSEWIAIARGMAFSLATALAAVATTLYWFGIFKLNQFERLHPQLMVYLLLAGVVLYGLMLRLGRIGSEAYVRLDRVWNERARILSTVDLPPGYYGFFRAVGDEAASLLASFQFLTWIVGKLNTAIAGMLRIISKILPRILLSLGVLALSVVVAEELSRDIIPKSLPGAIDSLYEWTNGSTLLGLVLWVLIALMASLSLALTSAFLVSIALVPSFGSSFLLTALFYDMAVEPVPFGRHVLHQLRFGRRGRRGLAHSATYSDAAAVQAVCAWMRTACEAAQQRQQKKYPKVTFVVDPAAFASAKRPNES